MTSLGRSSALLASGTMVSRVLGFAKSWLLVQAIGAIGLASGAYGTATTVPNSIYAIIAQGALVVILVPQIVRASAQHDDNGQAYINKLVTAGIAVFAIVAVVATLLAPWLVEAFGVRGAQAELATAFAYWSLPQIFFLGLYTLLGEVLNARKSFGPFTWAPVANNVVAILMLVVFVVLFGADPAGTRTDWSPAMTSVLAGGATLGIAAQALILFVFWRRVGLRFRLDFRWRGMEWGHVGRAAGWTFAMLLGTQLAGLIETNVTNSAGPQNPGVLTAATAWLLFMLPHGIIAVSIATASYTSLTEAAQRSDWRAFRADYSISTRTIAMFLVFCSVALIVAAFPISRIFTGYYLQMGPILMAYAVGLVPFSLLFVTQRSFYALSDTRTPFLFSLAQVGLVVVGAIGCLAVPAPHRAAAVALVVSVSGTAQAVLALALLRRRVGRLDGRRILAAAWRFAVAAIVSAGAGALTLWWLGGFTGGFAVSGILAAIASIAIVGIVMLTYYLATLIVLRSPELQNALQIGYRRLRRG